MYRAMAQAYYAAAIESYATTHLSKAEELRVLGRCAESVAEIQRVLTSVPGHLQARFAQSKECPPNAFTLQRASHLGPSRSDRSGSAQSQSSPTHKGTNASFIDSLLKSEPTKWDNKTSSVSKPLPKPPSKDVVKKIIEERISVCREGGSYGIYPIYLTISPDGTAKVSSPAYGHSVVFCMVKTLEVLRFPKFKGQALEFSYSAEIGSRPAKEPVQVPAKEKRRRETPRKEEGWIDPFTQ